MDFFHSGRELRCLVFALWTTLWTDWFISIVRVASSTDILCITIRSTSNFSYFPCVYFINLYTMSSQDTIRSYVLFKSHRLVAISIFLIYCIFWFVGFFSGHNIFLAVNLCDTKKNCSSRCSDDKFVRELETSLISLNFSNYLERKKDNIAVTSEVCVLSWSELCRIVENNEMTTPVFLCIEWNVTEIHVYRIVGCGTILFSWLRLFIWLYRYSLL